MASHTVLNKIISGMLIVFGAGLLLQCSSEQEQYEFVPSDEISNGDFDQGWYELEEAVELATENDRWVQVYVHVN